MEVIEKNKNYYKEDELNLNRYLQLIFYHKWLALLGILIGLAIGLILYVKHPVVYTSEFLVFLNNSENGVQQNDYLPKESDPGPKFWLDLMVSNKSFSALQQISGLNISPEALKQMFKISYNGKENCYNVKVTTKDPLIIPILADNYVKALNQIEKEKKQKRIQENIDFLNNQIAAKKQQLDSLNNYLLTFTGNLNIDNINSIEQFKDTYESFLKQLKETEVELNYVTTSRHQAERELESLNDTIFEESSFTEPLKVQLMNLQVDLARALTKYGKDHPVTVGIKNNIALIQKMLNEGFEQTVAVKNIKSNPTKNILLSKVIELKISEISLQAKVASLKKILNEYNYNIKDVSLLRKVRIVINN